MQDPNPKWAHILDEVYPQMRCTEPYYTKSVWPPFPPSIELVVQSPTTPGQFDLPFPNQT